MVELFRVKVFWKKKHKMRPLTYVTALASENFAQVQIKIAAKRIITQHNEATTYDNSKLTTVKPKF